MNNINELIPIEEKNGQRAVNARHLYVWLGSKRQFTDWMREQIENCDLVQDVDYQSFSQNCEKPNGGRPSIDYALSLNAAKEISMMARSQRGKEARRYFIDCEKALMSMQQPSYQIADPIERAKQWIEEQKRLMLTAKRAEEAEQQVLSLTSEIEKMQPKVTYYDKILNNKSTVLTTQIALDYGMSAKAFNKVLYDLRIQHKVGDQWILYAPHISQGYMHSKAIDIIRHDGRREVKYNSEWTQKGRLFLYATLKNNNILPLIEKQ